MELDEREWNFEPLKDSRRIDEVRACQVWEFGRESPSIRRDSSEWRCRISESRRGGGRNWPFLIQAFQSFPETPWLALSEDEQSAFKIHVLEKDIRVIPGLALAELALQPVRNDECRDDDPSEKADPLWRGQHLVILIEPQTWATYTNTQLSTALQQLVAAHRPNGIPTPKDEKGQRDQSRLASLRWLAAMRLFHHYTFLRAMKVAGVPKEAGFFGGSSNSSSSNRWSHREDWMDARRKANKKMHELFPFLPQNERPIHFRQAKE